MITIFEHNSKLKGIWRYILYTYANKIIKKRRQFKKKVGYEANVQNEREPLLEQKKRELSDVGLRSNIGRNNRQQNKCYPKGVYLFFSKLHSILAVANLLAYNNISQICYCGRISFQSAAVNCSFSDNLIPWGNIYFAGNGATNGN